MNTDVIDLATAKEHEKDILAGQRFAFGKNWARFLGSISPEVIEASKRSLQTLLKRERLDGIRFLDVGSGSGLSSLAAYQLGADVVSFDFDPDSVTCTKYLCDKFSIEGKEWTVLHGSVLDGAFLASLGHFDVVYSWGVLHHTGAMWAAIDGALSRVKREGTIALAIYNDQGAWSARWWKIKRLYVSGPVGTAIVAGIAIPIWVLRDLAKDIFWLRNPLHRYQSYKANRGMSVVTDWLDWLGGFPFEVAKPEELVFHLQTDGFRLVNLVTVRGSSGCFEVVMDRGVGK